MLFCNLEEEKNNMLDVSPSVASSLKKERKGKYLKSTRWNEFLLHCQLWLMQKVNYFLRENGDDHS